MSTKRAKEGRKGVRADAIRARALPLLLVGLSQRAVGVELGVNERTVAAWCAEPEFSEALKDAQTKATADAMERIARGATVAVDALVRIASSTTSEDRDVVAAAKELARLAGLRPPEKLEVHSDLASLSDEALAARLAALTERAKKLGGGT